MCLSDMFFETVDGTPFPFPADNAPCGGPSQPLCNPAVSDETHPEWLASNSGVCFTDVYA